MGLSDRPWCPGGWVAPGRWCIFLIQPLQICRNASCFRSSVSSQKLKPQTKSNLHFIILPSFLSLSLPSLLEDQSGLRIKFAALTLCDKMSSKTSRAWIIMPVILRSLALHLLGGGARCFGIWEPSDVNLAAGTEGNRFSDIMGHLRLCWHRISDSHRQTDRRMEMLILYLHMFWLFSCGTRLQFTCQNEFGCITSISGAGVQMCLKRMSAHVCLHFCVWIQSLCSPVSVCVHFSYVP